MSDKATKREVAQWMVEEVERAGILQQDRAARTIRSHFGDEFVYRNANNNLAINELVLKIFNELTGDRVVWSRSLFHWRKRKETDGPGRAQR